MCSARYAHLCCAGVGNVDGVQRRGGEEVPRARANDTAQHGKQVSAVREKESCMDGVKTE